MPTCALIVTGTLEKRGLPDFLGRRFAATGWSFQALLTLNGATSVPLARGTAHAPMQRLADALVKATQGGRNRESYELVLVVDDLELANQGQPEVVVDVLRDALEQSISRTIAAEGLGTAAENRLRTRLRGHASFHLLDPMPEAYFFDDAQALSPLGLTPAAVVLRPPYGTPGWNAEDFQADDPAFAPEVAASNAAMAAAGRAWWREERHPKRYLQHLMRPRTYFETEHGVAALAGLPVNAWPRQRTCPLLSSLLADIADAVGAPSPAAWVPASSTWPPPQHRVLRNL